MIDAPASKRFTAWRAVPEKNRISPLVWMNAVCLDAPLVAVSWVWLFARSFGAPVTSGGTAALFLTAWLIYLADRFGDGVSVDLRRATSFRQRFCVRHRRGWLIAIIAVAMADLAVVLRQLGRDALLVGLVIGVPATAYLLVNQLRPQVWRVIPAKEAAIGVLFAAGTMVPIASRLPPAAALPWLVFAALCTANCISIAVWERWLDDAQRRISVATVFPRVGGFVLPVLVLLASASFALSQAAGVARPIYLCVGASSSLLAFSHLFRRRIQSDVRTALADLALLTPLALVFI